MLRVLALDLLLPALLGGCATLGFAPFNEYGLTLLAITGLVALWWDVDARRGAWRGFVFGCAHFGTGVYWAFVSMYDYGGAPLVLAGVLTGLLVMYMAVFPMAVGAFSGMTRRVPRSVWALLLLPGAWLFAELVRSRLMTGFPWLSLGYSMINAPLTGLVPIGGVYLLGFLVLVAAGTVVLLFAGSLVGRMVAVLLIAATPFALWMLPPVDHWTRPDASALRVEVVQGNFPEPVKWQRSNFAATLRRYRDLTERSDADLVIWPEVAIPAPAGQVQSYLESIDSMATGRGQTVLAGILARKRPGGPYYNAVLALGSSHGEYDKRHLVPFGEYFPVPGFVRDWLDVINMPFQDLAFGPPRQPLIHVKGVTLGLSICFEDTFGYEIARALPEAGILVNVTNDAWFAGTTAISQHLQIARMRALESGRPMARAANTGISAVIGYDGRVRRRTAEGTVATLSQSITPRAGLTPYMRIGEWPLWVAGSGLVLIGLVWAGFVRGREN